jgi:uncharacterized peroxidase-related enzyme
MTYLRVTGDGPHYETVFSLAPEAYAAWRVLAGTVRDGMDGRRYELVTVTAARALGSAYCTLAHAAVLRERYFSAADVDAILAGRHVASLDPADVAAMDFAERIAVRPQAATAADLERLRAAGLSEQDILQVVLTVALRRFFAGVLDAVGAEPDPHLLGAPLR